jgi:hypothetical protein
MMMKTKNIKKKIAAIALAATMAISSTSMAAWNQFQNNDQNSGLITGTAPTSVTSSTSVTLNNNGAWTGIDAEPIMNGNNAYVLYNGGAVSDTDGGARLARVKISDTDTEGLTATEEDVQLDALADNVSQLSTPYQAADGTIYAATTDMSSVQNMALTDWKEGDTPLGTSAIIKNGTTVTYTYDNLTLAKQYTNPQLVTDINLTVSASGQYFGGRMIFTDKNTGTVYNLGNYNYSYSTSKLTLYNYEPNLVLPAGNYKVEVVFNNQTGSDVTLQDMQVQVSHWKLYGVATDANGALGTVTQLASGDGQVNTPIKANGNYLYFGIFEGDRCYYQYNVTGKALTAYTPNGGDDFYWAGATPVTINGNTYMVFGSDNAKLYVRQVGDNFGNPAQGATDTGKVVSVVSGGRTGGRIRCSISQDRGYLYFTDRNGYVWTTAVASLLNNSVSMSSYKIAATATASSSTPTIIGDYLYVGYENSSKLGGVIAFPITTPGTLDEQNLRVLYASGQVTSSIIGYEDDGYHYIYFTVNSDKGMAYCYQVENQDYVSKVNVMWSQDNAYGLQGMATDSGYMVFGNDSNVLTIVK